MSDDLLLYWGALVGALVSLAVVWAAARLKEWGAAAVAGVAALEFCGVAAYLGWVMWRWVLFWGGRVRTSQWDIVFVLVTVFGALVGAVCLAIALRATNWPYSNVAAVVFFVLSVAAALFYWKFL
jgi:hypothetical protein